MTSLCYDTCSMKRTIIPFLTCLILAGQALAHSSAKEHFEDVSTVFAGYSEDKGFKELFKAVSGGIDNELPKMFREKVGAVPGNHRILGHGWTLNAAIPKKTMDKLLKRYPDKKDDIIAIWATFARDCKAKAEELSGLPKNQANALASMIYDIHLVGDLEPDNKLLEDVLELSEIVKNFKKDADELFQNKPEYSSLIAKKLDEAMTTNVTLQAKATLVMTTLQNLRIGSMLHEAWGKTIKFQYSPDANVEARQIASEKRQGAGTGKDKGRATETASTNLVGKAYWVSKSCKIHNPKCQYFQSGEGTLTDQPTGVNCKKCGGADK
jgi:hypothetical protein